MSAIPACATMSWTPSLRRTRASRSSAIGGRPRPPWMRIGTDRSTASAKTGCSRSSLRANACARGCSLIPRAPRSRQRRASSSGCVGEIEADERDELPCRALGVGERPVVRDGERRLAVVLVEAEHERAARSRSGRASTSARRSSRPSRRCRSRDACGRRRGRRSRGARGGARSSQASTTSGRARAAVTTGAPSRRAAVSSAARGGACRSRPRRRSRSRRARRRRAPRRCPSRRTARRAPAPRR